MSVAMTAQEGHFEVSPHEGKLTLQFADGSQRLVHHDTCEDIACPSLDHGRWQLSFDEEGSGFVC